MSIAEIKQLTERLAFYADVREAMLAVPTIGVALLGDLPGGILAKPS